MFNNREGWMERGSRRGYSGSNGLGERGNAGNRHRGFRGSGAKGEFRGRGMGFGGNNRGFRGRDSFSGGTSNSANRGYRSNREASSVGTIGYSAGDQTLLNFTGNNKNESNSPVQHQRMLSESLNNFSSHLSNSNCNEHPHFSNTNNEVINQSPDISSSTTSPIKVNQRNYSSLPHSGTNVHQLIPSTSSSNIDSGSNLNSSSQPGAIRCEPCDVGIVGEATYRFHLEGTEHQRKIEKYSSTSDINQRRIAVDRHDHSMGHSLELNPKYDAAITGVVNKKELPEVNIHKSYKAVLGDEHSNKDMRLPQCKDESKPTIPSLLEIPTFKPPEKYIESVFDDTLVLLDPYTSDLNLELEETEFCSAKPKSEKGFGYMWAGTKATYGITKGRVCFEVIIDSNNDISHLENEKCPNVLRCGWSSGSASMQLGEEPFSWGYGGTGTKSLNCKFTTYGQKFGVGDVIGCYLDMTCDPHTIGYTVNGFPQGVAFSVAKNVLNGQALFPHILTKNQNFTVNFGQLPAPLKQLLPNFIPIGQLDLKDGLVRGPVAPFSRQKCEVLMMIGLPGAGKTFWAEKYSRANPDKSYNILGTNNLIDRMKVMGLSRSRNYHGRWELLIDKCTDCFNTLLKIAAKRNRNYILDQTNVFPTARVRKIRDFQEMCCKAIVVLPTDQEFQRRCAIRTQEFGKEIPESAVVNMKANFVLPEYEEVQSKIFSDVIYVELDPYESRELVQNYNVEAIRKGVHMTPAVNHFVSRNNKMRADGNMFEPMGKLLPLIESTSKGSVKYQGESFKQIDLSGNETYSTTKQEHFPNTRNTQGNIDFPFTDSKLPPTDMKIEPMEQIFDNVTVPSDLKICKDEFGRDSILRQHSPVGMCETDLKNNTNTRVKDERDVEKDMQSNTYERKEVKTSRSTGRDIRSRSKSIKGRRNNRRSKSRSRTKSRERDRRNRRRRKSRDRSRSRERIGFGRSRGYNRDNRDKGPSPKCDSEGSKSTSPWSGSPWISDLNQSTLGRNITDPNIVSGTKNKSTSSNLQGHLNTSDIPVQQDKVFAVPHNYVQNEHMYIQNNPQNQIMPVVEQTNLSKNALHAESNFSAAKNEPNFNFEQHKSQSGFWNVENNPSISDNLNTISGTSSLGKNMCYETSYQIDDKNKAQTASGVSFSSYNVERDTKDDILKQFSIRDLDPEWSNNAQEYQCNDRSDFIKRSIEQTHPFQEEDAGFGQCGAEFGGGFGFSVAKQAFENYGMQQVHNSSSPKQTLQIKYPMQNSAAGSHQIRKQTVYEQKDILKNQPENSKEGKGLNADITPAGNPEQKRYSQLPLSGLHPGSKHLEIRQSNLIKQSKNWANPDKTITSENQLNQHVVQGKAIHCSGLRNDSFLSQEENHLQYITQYKKENEDKPSTSMSKLPGIRNVPPPPNIGGFPTNIIQVQKQDRANQYYGGNASGINREEYCYGNEKQFIQLSGQMIGPNQPGNNQCIQASETFPSIPFHQLPPPPIPPQTMSRIPQNLQQHKAYEFAQTQYSRTPMANSSPQRGLGDTQVPTQPPTSNQNLSIHNNVLLNNHGVSPQNKSQVSSKKSESSCSSESSTTNPSTSAPDYSALLQYIQHYQQEMSTEEEKSTTNK